MKQDSYKTAMYIGTVAKSDGYKFSVGITDDGYTVYGLRVDSDTKPGDLYTPAGWSWCHPATDSDLAKLMSEHRKKWDAETDNLALRTLLVEEGWTPPSGYTISYTRKTVTGETVFFALTDMSLEGGNTPCGTVLCGNNTPDTLLRIIDKLVGVEWAPAYTNGRLIGTIEWGWSEPEEYKIGVTADGCVVYKRTKSTLQSNNLNNWGVAFMTGIDIKFLEQTKQLLKDTNNFDLLPVIEIGEFMSGASAIKLRVIDGEPYYWNETCKHGGTIKSGNFNGHHYEKMIDLFSKHVEANAKK